MTLINDFLTTLVNLWMDSGIVGFFYNSQKWIFLEDGWRYLLMIAISFVLMYLAIVKEFEPLLLLPIAFGMFLTNLPFAGVFDPAEVARVITDVSEMVDGETLRIAVEKINNVDTQVMYAVSHQTGGLIYYLYQGVKMGIYPPLIFLGIGCMTDFGPLIANPKSFLLGAAAQVGIFVTFIGAMVLDSISWLPVNYNSAQAGSIAIIGGADGPTAIYVTTKLAQELLPSIAVAAYSYMALVPIIQPPIMKALTNDKERLVVMEQLRPVSKRERILFPIITTLVVALLVPSAAPLVGMLMLGNILKESGVTERLSKTAQNELMNIITIFLGVSVGATATAQSFLNLQTVFIILLGLVAFCFGTAGGVLFGKIMYRVTGGKVNPLIGSAGVSAVPMAARVSQKVGAEYNPSNFLLMHAMGPNVAGVIGSAVAAGVLISILGG